MIREYFCEVEKKLEEIAWLIKKKKFQFMNGNNRLIYRWDSAPHHKEITSFPFHLHTPEGVRECEKVNLIEVFEIIKALMLKRAIEREDF